MRPWSLLLACFMMGCANQDAQEVVERLLTKPMTATHIGEATLAGIYDEPITLQSGTWEGDPFVEGGAARPRVWWLPQLLHQGDLDADGRPDVLAYFGENSGGTGTFLYLAWLVPGEVDAAPRSRAVFRVGDRVQIVRALLAQNRLRLRLISASPDDGACCPTQIEERLFSFEGAQIRQEVEVVGRATLEEIAGVDWMLERLGSDGEPIPEEAPTLRIEGDRVSGFGGCNRYHATIAPGEGRDIALGPIASTRMACPGPGGEIEPHFFEALAAAQRWGFMMGQLTLSYGVDDDRLLFFSRAED